MRKKERRRGGIGGEGGGEGGEGIKDFLISSRPFCSSGAAAEVYEFAEEEEKEKQQQQQQQQPARKCM
ncbi:hypothetical protein E2C01_086323 [Portunus trituberculatus]|uniref:Uncharacterized protein n=1 Tax=Portunus trituberculatus TaxID=210409 RepID=A0A5B7JEA4_PORTR|nr:hypothetical protein [Portunus trituberculatus]